MDEHWFSDVTRRALTWGAWAVVVATVLSSGSPAEAHSAAHAVAPLSVPADSTS